MLYGDKERFGIEFDLNDDPGGAWMFGRFCYWIGGEQVGSFDEGTSLRDVLFSMKYIIGDAGSRTAPSLALCDTKEIFRLIQESLDESGDGISKLIPAELMPGQFDICPRVDIFDAWHIYLVDAREISKIVCSADGGNTVVAIELPLGEFDTIASSVCEKLDGLLETFQ
ncbi:Imm42 family immunity protein [Trinickia sp. YCB016]